MKPLSNGRDTQSNHRRATNAPAQLPQSPADATEAPAVTILMPTYNEANFIMPALESLTDNYVKANAEILVLDGNSSDETVALAEKACGEGFPVRVLHNDKRLQCFALNLGIREAQGKYIVRVDGHSTYPRGYVRRLVELLETTEAVNVGGVMLAKGIGRVQQAVATAMRHKVGVGNAKFHLGNYKGYVDTVYLGAFRKEIFQRVGNYDTNCRTNEDAELNIRIQKAGEKIYLDSSIEVVYRPRDTLAKLALQYFRYGVGRAYTTIKHRRITSLRQLAAPVLVMGLAGSLLLGFQHPLFLLTPLLYPMAIAATALFSKMPEKITAGIRLRLIPTFMIMHLTWGTGFILSFIKNLPRLLKGKPNSRETGHTEQRYQMEKETK